MAAKICTEHYLRGEANCRPATAEEEKRLALPAHQSTKSTPNHRSSAPSKLGGVSLRAAGEPKRTACLPRYQKKNVTTEMRYAPGSKIEMAK